MYIGEKGKKVPRAPFYMGKFSVPKVINKHSCCAPASDNILPLGCPPVRLVFRAQKGGHDPLWYFAHVCCQALISTQPHGYGSRTCELEDNCVHGRCEARMMKRSEVKSKFPTLMSDETARATIAKQLSSVPREQWLKLLP